jgi:hypothetical protein
VQTDNRQDAFIFQDLFGWLRTNYPAAAALTPKQLSVLDTDGTLQVCGLIRPPPPSLQGNRGDERECGPWRLTRTREVVRKALAFKPTTRDATR